MKNVIKPICFATIILLFGISYARIGYAVGSYYLDARKNDRSYSTNYSQSEVYASASNSNSYSDATINTYTDSASKKRVIEKNTTTSGGSKIDTKSYVVDGDGKKIYNTIIVRTNKSSKTKKNTKKVKTAKTIKTQEEVVEEEQPIKKKKIKDDYDKTPMRPEERAILDEEQIEENNKKVKKRVVVEEEEDEDYRSDTKKKKDKKKKNTTLADWYIYGLGGYSMTIPFWSSFNSTIGANPAVEQEFPLGHGFHFAFGAKFYAWHFFLSPEFMYQRFDINVFNNNQDYGVRIYETFVAGVGIDPTIHNAVQNTKVDLTDMLIGGVRAGLTFGTNFSIYVRGNIGMVNLKTKMTTDFTQAQYNSADMFILAQYQEQKANLPQYSKNNWAFIYGLGAGLEFGFLQQHLFFRVEYNHYWMPSKTITLPIAMADGSKEFKYKAHFGVLLFSFGIAI